VTAPAPVRPREFALVSLEQLIERQNAQAAQLFSVTTSYALAKYLPAAATPYDGDVVWKLGQELAGISLTAQRTSSGLTASYLQMTLRLLGSPLGKRLAIGAAVGVGAFAVRKGIDLARAYERPMETIRYEQSQGVEPEQARERGRLRLLSMLDTDIQLAARDAARNVLRESDDVSGYRRILRPEMSRGTSCGLCVAASDRVYSVEELLPLHPGCHCGVAPIVGEHDPGRELNEADFAALYGAAGSTAAADLRDVEVAVKMHGELGPVLVDARHHFRGPRAAAAAAA
jgi:hypothetical protein